MDILFRILKGTYLGHLIWKLTGWVLVQEAEENGSLKYYWSNKY
jgi:hypothetical protein